MMRFALKNAPRRLLPSSSITWNGGRNDTAKNLQHVKLTFVFTHVDLDVEH